MEVAESEPLLKNDNSASEVEEATDDVLVVRPSDDRRRMYNVIVLGLGFMMVFTAFQTSSSIEQSIIRGIKKEHSSYYGDGYISLAIIYIVFALSNWLAPSVVSILRPRISMVICALVYNVFIASFLYPLTWALYLFSALLGLSAAVLWTAQGEFLTVNSNSSTMGRNSGIFWCLLQCSMLIGNVFVYFEFKGGSTTITTPIRMTVYEGLTGACFVGVLLLCILRKPPKAESDTSVNAEESTSYRPGPIQAFIDAFRLQLTKNMLLLSVTFMYTGFSLTFFSGVFGTCVGSTKRFGDDRKDLIPITGILLGAGEASGGFLFGLLGKITNKYGRDFVILIAYVLQLGALFLLFLNLPDDSPLGETSLPTYMLPNRVIIFVCAYVLGLSDACFNTQIMSILGVVYSENSAPAFALFKFMQSLAAAIGFFYSTVLVLKYQLLIIVAMATFGTLSFNAVEWSTYKSSQARD